jgi:N utilization substance protein B
MRVTRSDSRAEALKILYMSEITEEEVKYERAAEKVLDGEISSFAREIIEGVQSNLKEIDEKIKLSSANWKLFRMSIIDRNILRIACYEILFRPEIPGNVTINEAVELAKKFGGEDSGAFINGILDHIAREAGKIPGKEGNENQFHRETARKI